MNAYARFRLYIVPVLAVMIVAIAAQQASALIEGGKGNDPIRDPGWPAGAAAIFNTQSRIAYWVGPPFGGGQWHAECRGDSEALGTVLADFAKLDVENKRVVLHDGIGRSFWLNPNDDPANRDAAMMDWVFMVWQKASWERLRQLPPELNPADPQDRESGPPAQIDIYTGGSVNWDEVSVPEGLTIIDHRLEAHGFTVADGVVLEGKVVDLATKYPVTAKVTLERVEPQPEGGYRHRIVAEAVADAEGHWVLKQVPAGWHRIVVATDGFVPRVAGYGRFDDQPRWQNFDSRLSRAAHVAGRVIDDADQPLADVEVRIGSFATEGGERYESPLGHWVKTDKDGQFRAEQVPIGTATIRVHKPGYVRPGESLKTTTPSNGIELKMIRSARVEVTVDFLKTERPEEYIVQIQPEGGSKVGAFGGSGNIDDQNQIVFEHVPPGRYDLSGRPNPGSDNQQTEPVTVMLNPGQTAKVTLIAI